MTETHVPSFKYVCSKHGVWMSLVTRRFSVGGKVMRFWKCPIEGCVQTKPCKYGKSIGKRT